MRTARAQQRQYQTKHGPSPEVPVWSSSPRSSIPLAHSLGLQDGTMIGMGGLHTVCPPREPPLSRDWDVVRNRTNTRWIFANIAIKGTQKEFPREQISSARGQSIGIWIAICYCAGIADHSNLLYSMLVFGDAWRDLVVLAICSVPLHVPCTT